MITKKVELKTKWTSLNDNMVLSPDGKTIVFCETEYAFDPHGKNPYSTKTTKITYKAIRIDSSEDVKEMVEILKETETILKEIEKENPKINEKSNYKTLLNKINSFLNIEMP